MPWNPEGYENSDSLCCQHIFMDETTEKSFIPEGVAGGVVYLSGVFYAADQ